jgi:hypothetical protein
MLLFVGVKAVEFHLAHVFDKVGIRSRQLLPGRLAEAAGAAAGGNRAQTHRAGSLGISLATSLPGPVTLEA